MKFNKTLLQVLAPYGNWPHPKGNQIVDEISADAMIAASKRVFAPRAIPIYVGHPDETRADCGDQRVGTVRRILKTKNGIIIEACYSDGIFGEIAEAKIKALSPRWEMECLGGNDYRPVRLVSVGLTNSPNIAGSGRILDALPHIPQKCESEKRGLDSIKKAVRRIQNKTEAARKNLAGLADSLRNSQIDRRLVALDRASAQNIRGEKRLMADIRELSEMAKKLSAETGQPYTKAFAKIRKTKICRQ